MLEGKFFIRDDEDNYYVTGRIVEKIGESVYLIEIDSARLSDAPCRPRQLVDLETMMAVRDCGHPRWRFFDTAKERKAWLAWVDTPDPDSGGEKVVRIKH